MFLCFLRRLRIAGCGRVPAGAADLAQRHLEGQQRSLQQAEKKRWKPGKGAICSGFMGFTYGLIINSHQFTMDQR